MISRIRSSLWLVALLVLLAPTVNAVDIEWLTVRGAGNSCDTQLQGCFGAVGARYRISKFSVTNAQYAEFLNAVASTDTNLIYNGGMATGFGGIKQSGTSGSFTYTALPGREDKPVVALSFWPTLRFANWLHNGQPTGAQDVTTTEDGAYRLTPEGISGNSITRNAGARVFLPSEDEWYKAAYYSAASSTYFDYPAGSDTQTTCSAVGATANTANCASAVGDLTDVGSYTASASPAGTFDQGGNTWEWNETITGPGVNRVVRGGMLTASASFLAASSRAGQLVTIQAGNQGFRVASLVEAPMPALGPIPAALLGGLLTSTGLLLLVTERGRRAAALSFARRVSLRR